MLVPAGTPRGIIERLNGEIVRSLRDPQITDQLAAQGIEVVGSTPEEFLELIKTHLANLFAKLEAESLAQLIRHYAALVEAHP